MLIAIEGCLGAGKTTVASGLAALRESTLLLEDFEANPFLRAFYDDPTGNAIETEFAFLMVHFHQLKSVARMPSGRETIADFHLGKDVLYADLNIVDQRVKRVFSDLYRLCSEEVAAPDLLVFLSASTDLVVSRIRQRSRDFELVIDPEYYAAINEAYERHYEDYPGRKLRVDMDTWDFVRNPELYESLNGRLTSELNQK